MFSDIFSPLVAFPLLYLAWFAVGSMDVIEVPASFSFGLFDPIPGYVLGYAALGLVSYLAGAIFGQKTLGRNMPDRKTLTLKTPGGSILHHMPLDQNQGRLCQFGWRRDRFMFAIGVLTVLMIGFYVYIVAGIGTIPSLSADAGEIRLQITRYGAAEAVMFTCAWTLIPMLMMYVWRCSPRQSAKILSLFGALVSALFLVSLGGRSYLFVPLLTTLIARHYAKRRFTFVHVATVGLALFLGLSLFGYARDTALTGSEFAEQSLGIPASVVPFAYAYLYVRYPVATFRDITEVIPQKVPYQMGALSLGPLETVLPGHHEQSDMFFKDILGNDFPGAGQPATLLGPLYADGGWMGIVAGLFLAGFVSARAYGWMLAEPSAIRVLLYAWLTQTVLFSLFANLFPYVTTIWIPVFWIILDRWMRKTKFGTSLCLQRNPICFIRRAVCSQ
jgi:oligosaccharide repeat unit polymerase